LLAEVVMAHIIPALRFTPTKREIIWRFGNVASPTVEGAASLKPVMPVMVERVMTRNAA